MSSSPTGSPGGNPVAIGNVSAVTAQALSNPAHVPEGNSTNPVAIGNVSAVTAQALSQAAKK